MKNENKKNLISSIIKWCVIILVLVIVYFWKRDVFNAAFREMGNYSKAVPLLCFIATLLHFVTEGFVIHTMTMYEKRQMTWWEAFKCGLYCAFIKFASMGSLSGIAEVYYISKHDIDPGRASGIMLVQYAYQKLGVTILGLISFITLYIANISTIREYAKLGILGTLVALFIVMLLIAVSASKKVADFLAWLVRKILGKDGIISKIRRGRKDGNKVKKIDENELPENQEIERKPDRAGKLVEKIYTFNDSGLYFWQHKSLCVKVTLLKTLKMFLWYCFAGIVVCAAGYGGAGTFLMSVMLMAVANMIGSVMAAPAGVGTLEFVVSLLFTPLYGTTAVTVAILYRFFSMVVPFILGAFVFATDKKEITEDT